MSNKIRERKIIVFPAPDAEQCRSKHVFSKSLRTVAVEYLENSTIAGCRHLVDPKTHWFEKAIWMLVIGFAVVGVAYMSMQIWEGFIDKPAYVSLISNQYPIWKVPFPAIALCNANKISKKKITEYAEYLSGKSGFPTEIWLQYLLYLGRNIDHSIVGFDNYTHFMDVLNHYEADKKTGIYDTLGVMRMLSPSCENMLVACRWKGKKVKCSDIFEMRRTMEGFCCTFNYVRSIDNMGSNVSKHETLSANTYLMGLMVLLNPEVEDYFYMTRISAGINMLVFSPHNYPDVNGGNLRERFYTLNTENYVGLRATTLLTTPAVRRFSSIRRGCIFNDELPEKYGDLYTFANCIVRCKMKVMYELCKCVAFFLPTVPNATICSLDDIPCLNKYHTKFGSILAKDFNEHVDSALEGFEEEKQDGMYCEECLSDCSHTKYDIKYRPAPLSSAAMRDIFAVEGNFTNHVAVMVYYTDFDTDLYQMDAVYYWFEMISNFGGIGGLFLGFSLISIFEFVYYFTVQLFAEMRRRGYKIFGRF